MHGHATATLISSQLFLKGSEVKGPSTLQAPVPTGHRLLEMSSRRRWLAVALATWVLSACTGQTAVQPTPSPSAVHSTVQSPSPATTTPLAVYDGPTLDGRGHVVYVVGIGDYGSPNCSPDCSFAAPEMAKVLASVEAAGRTEPPSQTGSLQSTAVALPYVSTSRTRAYFLDGDSKLRAVTPDGKVATVGTVPGTPTVHVAFAVSPDDSMLALAAIDYSIAPIAEKVYVSSLDGSGRVDLFASAGPYYWPVGWHDGSVVLAIGPVLRAGSVPANQYGASGYAIVQTAAGSKPLAVGAGDCVPNGLLTAAGTACIAPHAKCLGAQVGVSGSSTYYASCLRRLGWDGKETTFLLTGNTQIGDVIVNHAALSADGHVIMTDRLFWVAEPAAGGYPGFQAGFAGSSAPFNTMPDEPGMGWIDLRHVSILFVDSNSGSTYQRIYSLTSDLGGFRNVYFAGSPANSFVPTSPVIGQLVGTLPGGL